MWRGIGPRWTVPFDGLGINAGVAIARADIAAIVGPPQRIPVSGRYPRVVRHRVARLVPVLVVLTITAACTPVASGPGTSPAAPAAPSSDTGNQNGPLGGCPVFPADNAWNTDISTLPLRANSTAIVNQVLADGPGILHADFGGGGAYGIPYVTVPGTHPHVPVTFNEFASESDPGPYPIPLGAPIEGGSDRHVITIDRDHCQLYELYHATSAGDHWDAGSGATWDLRSDALRPAGWTSADAAGLPIFPGLARYDEVTSGVEDLRDDRRRQRHELLRHRRVGSPLG
jgi:hypothetical protein